MKLTKEKSQNIITRETNGEKEEEAKQYPCVHIKTHTAVSWPLEKK